MTVVHSLVLIICVLHHVQLTMLPVSILTLHVVGKLIYIYNTLILYYTVCDYTCGPGEAVNATCNGCDLTDICQRDIPCQNGGSCILLSAPNNYTCNCSGTGYAGEHCSVNINECDPNPCKNGATCVDGVANYICICSVGYTGKNCNICDNGYLLNNATICGELLLAFF